MGKLIRGKVPDIIKARGQEPIVKELDDVEFLFALGNKAVEQAWNFAEATENENGDEILEALANLQEIISTTLVTIGKFPEELEKTRAQLLEEFGGYESRVYLEEVV